MSAAQKPSAIRDRSRAPKASARADSSRRRRGHTPTVGENLHDALLALYAIEALACVLGLDPTNEFDRTAVAALIEREARRASGIVGAAVARRSGAHT